eukprot:gene4865-8459_t
MSNYDNLDTKVKIQLKNEQKIVKLKDKLFYLAEEDPFKKNVVKWVSKCSIDPLQAVLLVHHNFLVGDLGYLNMNLLLQLQNQENGLTIHTINMLSRENLQCHRKNFNMKSLDAIKDLKPHLEKNVMKYETKEILEKIKQSIQHLKEAEEYIIHDMSLKLNDETIVNRLTNGYSSLTPLDSFDEEGDKLDSSRKEKVKSQYTERKRAISNYSELLNHNYFDKEDNRWHNFVEVNFDYFEEENDSQMIQKLKDSQEEKLIKLYLKSLISFHHSIGILISRFISRMLEFHHLKHFFLLNCFLYLDGNQNDFPDINEIIDEFIDIFTSILLEKHWHIDSEIFIFSLKMEMKEFILSKGFYYKTFLNCQKLFAKEDLKFYEMCEKVNLLHEISLEDFNVNDQFLSADFSVLIVKLKELDFPTSFDEKIDLISSSIAEISSVVSNTLKEEILLSTDEMIPILIFCVIKSLPLNLISIFNYLKDNLNEINSKGIEGYCVSTLETVIDEILNLKIDENLKIKKLKIFGNLNLLTLEQYEKKTLKKISYLPFMTNKEVSLDITQFLSLINWKDLKVKERIELMKKFFENCIFQKKYRNHCIFYQSNYSKWKSLKIFSIDYFFFRCGFGNEQISILNASKKIKYNYHSPIYESIFNSHDEKELLSIKYWCLCVTESEYFVGLSQCEIDEEMNIKIKMDPKKTWTIVRNLSSKENMIKNKLEILQ